MKAHHLIYLFILTFSLSAVGCSTTTQNVDDSTQSDDSNNKNEVYTVLFETGFDKIVESQQIRRGDKVIRPIIERTGYTLKYWHCNGEEWKFNSDVVLNNMTLTAFWVPNTYVVSFDCGNEFLLEPITVTFDEFVTLPTVERQGFDFCGWFADDVDLFTTGTWNIPKDVVLKPRFSAKIFTILLDAGDGEVYPTTYKVRYGEQYQLPIPTKDNIPFRGWMIDGSFITDASGYSLESWSFLENKTFTVKWEIEIKNRSDLESINDYKNAYFLLLNDIDLNNGPWTPLCIDEEFTGTLDGNGHKITNLNINNNYEYVGLFAKCSGTIKNLSLVDVNISIATTSVDSYIGALAGYETGLNVENCVISGEIHVAKHSTTLKTKAGGVFGYVKGNNSSTNLSEQNKALNAVNCSINITINGCLWAGGFAGYVDRQNCNFINCEIMANINAFIYASGYISSACYLNATFIDSFCRGKIESGDSVDKKGITAAGFVGYLDKTKDREVSFLRSVNFANITCHSEGPSSTSLYSSPSAGGFYGIIHDVLSGLSQYPQVIFTSCINRGNVSSNADAGGLIGNTTENIIINECANLGMIKGDGRVGGLVGGSDRDVQIQDSFNKGSVLSSGSTCGGLFGFVSSIKLTKHLYNTADASYAGIGNSSSGGVYESANFGEAINTIGSGGTDCYYNVANYSNSQGTETTMRYDKELYVNLMYWSEEIWEFSINDYPYLKSLKELIILQ